MAERARMDFVHDLDWNDARLNSSMYLSDHLSSIKLIEICQYNEDNNKLVMNFQRTHLCEVTGRESSTKWAPNNYCPL